MSENVNEVKEEKKESKKGMYIALGGMALIGYLFGVKAGKKIAAKDIAKGFKKNWYTLLDDSTGASVPLYFPKGAKPQVDLFLDRVNKAFESAEELKAFKAIAKEG